MAAERELSASLIDTKAPEVCKSLTPRSSPWGGRKGAGAPGIFDDFVIFTRGFGDQEAAAAASPQHARALAFLVASTRRAGASGFGADPLP